MTLIKKTVSFITASSVMLFSFAPLAFAQGSTDISGNGSFSTNTSSVSQTSSNTAVQNNASSITNSVNISSNTGGNTGNDNTGGSTFISTGGSASSVDIHNMSNLNQVGSNMLPSSVKVESPVSISGNGSGSANSNFSSASDTNSLFQSNTNTVNNSVNVASQTGGNTADRNTNGDTSIVSGNSLTQIGIHNMGNVNSAGLPSVESMSALQSTGDGSTIHGNGSFSQNSIASTLDRTSSIVQDNLSNIGNFVVVSGASGNNSANDSTGGSVVVDSGKVGVGLNIGNYSNLNMANPFSSALSALGNDATISGNGSLSNNSYTRSLTDSNSIFQGAGNEGNGNSYLVNNALNVSAASGDNQSNRNTLGSGDVALVASGNSYYDSRVTNVGNANEVGNSFPMLNFGFDMGSMFNALF